jgi:hypothetical protein
MVKRPSTRRRSARRGMTVLIVMLVIMMLTAVGIFAARSSQLGVSNSGRYRAMLQTHFIAEAGMQGAIAEFSRDPEGYLTLLHASPSPTTATATSYPCFDIPFQPANAGFTPASTLCLRLGYQAVQAAAVVGGANVPAYDSQFNLFRPSIVAGTGIRGPGSLGRSGVAGNFVVEFTDERPVETPPPGMALSKGPAATLKFVTVTARAMGQVVPADSAGDALTAASSPNSYVSSVETIRAEVMVGPIQ